MSDTLPYRNPLVRDLAWTLGSPPLLRRTDDGLRWLDDAWFASITDCYRKRLQALDIQPGPLQRFVEAQRDRRLGNYFETLWRFWLDTNDRFRLLHANLPLRNGERTLGEFDFLVRDTQSGQTLHWEVAVKFYLGTGDTTQAANWWGPARRDRLDIKTQRLLQHQGRLSLRPEAQPLLARLGIAVDETWLILKGRLFYPMAGDAGAPPGHDPHHLRGFWLRQSSLPALEDACWLPLERDQWLAPVAGTATSDCLDRAALARRWASTPLQRPICIARINAGREAERGFVVPDEWG